MMNGDRNPAWDLDFYDLEFLADPYPALARVREATPILRNEQTGQWMLTRFGEVYETLRDRRLGRVYHHRYRHAELGQPAPDPRWASFQQHERWSLLSLEPPDHTRISGSWYPRCSRPVRCSCWNRWSPRYPRG